MLKPAFSTVACPEWTLATVAERALEMGFESVELRTFATPTRQFACEPALTSEQKVRRLFGDRGIELACLATSCRFDEPVFPPVIGQLSAAIHRAVREAQSAIDLAVSIECPLVRVFGFELVGSESRASGLKRIAGRLRDTVDHADKSGVKVVVENGGSFASAALLAELIERVDHPLLGACYALAAGQAAGDDPAAAVNALGDRLLAVRIKDLRDGRPVALGTGELACRTTVEALIKRGFNGPVIFEWDRAWMPELEGPDTALRRASATLFEWLGGRTAAGGSPVPAAGTGRR